MELAMIDDRIFPLEEAMISAHDRSVYFGDGVYEAVRLCNGKLFAMDRHMIRLENSLRQMDMLQQTNLTLIRRRIERAIDQADVKEAMVYFQISRGSALRSHDYNDDFTPLFFLTVRKFESSEPRAITAITHPDWRWKRCDIKSLNLLANIMARHAAVKAGAYEAILVDESNLVTEATSSSVLIIKDNLLKTAPLSANILPGITRAILLEQAGNIGLNVKLKSFSLQEALGADELFITGTGAGVMGIGSLNDIQVASGQLGKYTLQFHRLLLKAMYA